jgi:F-type H+-transporting ATPase subunit c
MILENYEWIKAASVTGASLAVGFAAIGAAIGEGYTAGKANETISYRPKLAGEVLRTMLVGQAVAETAGIFGLVIAMLLLFSPVEGQPMLAGWAYIGAGLSMGLAAIGCGIGAGLPAGSACQGIGRQPKMGGQLMTMMLIGAGVAQSTAIYGFLIALLMLYKTLPDITTWVAICSLLGAGFCMGFGGIGPGIGEGFAAETAVAAVARNPKTLGLMTRSMLVGQAVSESTGIYALVIALLLILNI